jgi:hypothetical protein
MQATSAVQRPFALAAALALILSALAAAASPAAKADTFTPGAAAPVVTITGFSEVIQPHFGNSSQAPGGAVAYFVTVQVVDSDGVDTIEEVSICLFNGASADGADCADFNANPKTMFYMDWLADDVIEGDLAVYGPNSSGNTGFAVGNADSLYAIGGGDDLSSWETEGGTTPGTLTLTFRFYVSAAMLAGNDWTVRATATDDADLEGTATTLTDAVTVQYFGAVTTARTSIDYGTIAPGASVAVIDQPLGRFVANDRSETNLVGEDFTYTSGPFTSTLDLVDSVTPGSGEVSLRCWRGDVALGDSEFIRVVPITPLDLPSSVFGGVGAARGTGETPIELKHGCELFYGGGALVSSQQYQADITVGIRQAD